MANIIYTKTELKRELNAGANRIIVGGTIARELEEKEQSRRARKNIGIGAIIFGLLFAPITGGASLIPAAVGTLTGLTLTVTAAELAIIVGGIVSVSAIKNGYDVTFNSDGTVTLDKK